MSPRTGALNRPGKGSVAKWLRPFATDPEVRVPVSLESCSLNPALNRTWPFKLGSPKQPNTIVFGSCLAALCAVGYRNRCVKYTSL